ncbi:MAG: oligosaccharide flippase family protein, partial [bacterium]
GLIGIIQLVNALKGLVVLPVITKLLGAKNYGIWAQLGVSLSLIPPLALLGLPTALVRFLATKKDKKEIREEIYSSALIIFSVSTVIALLIFFFAAPIAVFFRCQPILIQIFSLIIVFECLNSLFLNIFRSFGEIGKFSFFTIFQSIGEVSLIALTVLLGYGLSGAIASLFVIRFITFLILAVLIVKKIGIGLPRFSKTKEYLSFGIPTVISGIAYWFVTSSDKFLIGSFLGPLAVGYYSPPYTLGNTLYFFVFPFIIVLPTILPKYFDENKIEEVRSYMQYSLKYFLLVAIPCVFGLSVLSKPLLEFFSTVEIASNGYLITPFIALSVLLYGSYTVIAQTFGLLKKTKLIGKIWIITAVFNFSLNFLAIPVLGIIGAAITTLLAYALALSLTFYYTSKDLAFKLNNGFIVKSIFASILMSLPIFWYSPNGFRQIIIAIIFGVVAYTALVFLFNGLDKKETAFLKQLLTPFRTKL